MPRTEQKTEEQQEQVNEYGKFIEGERGWCLKHREEYEEMKKSLPSQAFAILRQIALKITQVNADSPPSKSHYAMGQCRQIMAGWDKELGLIEKFDKAEKRITKWDLEQAQK